MINFMMSMFMFFPFCNFKNIRKYKLRLFDVDISSVHGGSIKYFICKEKSNHRNTSRLKKQIKIETNAKMNKFSTYLKFASRVKKSKDLVFLLKKLKKKKKKLLAMVQHINQQQYLITVI